jgi:hypothetical protein
MLCKLYVKLLERIQLLTVSLLIDPRVIHIVHCVVLVVWTKSSFDNESFRRQFIAASTTPKLWPYCAKENSYASRWIYHLSLGEGNGWRMPIYAFDSSPLYLPKSLFALAKRFSFMSNRTTVATAVNQSPGIICTNSLVKIYSLLFSHCRIVYITARWFLLVLVGGLRKMESAAKPQYQ